MSQSIQVCVIPVSAKQLETRTIEKGKSMFIVFEFYYFLGVALSILALLPYMIQHFNEPDDFCLSCAAIVGQVRQPY